MSTDGTQPEDQGEVKVEEIFHNTTGPRSHGGHDASGGMCGPRKDGGKDESVSVDILALAKKRSPKAAELLLENPRMALDQLDGEFRSYDGGKHEDQSEWSSWRFPPFFSRRGTARSFLDGLCDKSGMVFARDSIEKLIEEKHYKSRPWRKKAGDTHFSCIEIDQIIKNTTGEYTSFGTVVGYVSVEDVVNEHGVGMTNFCGNLQASVLRLNSKKLQSVENMTDEHYEMMKQAFFNRSVASMGQNIFGSESLFVQDTEAEQEPLNWGFKRENYWCRGLEGASESSTFHSQQKATSNQSTGIMPGPGYQRVHGRCSNQEVSDCMRFWQAIMGCTCLDYFYG